MKKILLALLISTGVYGNFATVDCTEMSKVIELLQGYTKVCQIDTDVHTFTQSFDRDVNGTVEYEDGEIIAFSTVGNVLTVNIEADRPFLLKINSYISNRLKLSLLTDGAESWKYFYTGTSRWRKYDFPLIYIEPVVDEPIVIEPPIIVPPVLPPDGNVTSLVYDFSSFYTKTDEVLIQSRILHEDLTPFEGVRVQVIAGDTTHEAITDNLGVFTVLMTVDTPFTVRAWNTLSEPNDWAIYANQMRITSEGLEQEEVGGVWVASTKEM